jgi:tetratricopeptide (TPR) repeat protein
MKSGAGIAGTAPGRADPQTDQRFSLREAARILELPEARLRALARAGFLAPQRGPLGPLSVGFPDLILLRTTKGLLEAGVPMRRIRTIWSSLRAQLTDDLPLTSISIHTDGEAVVASDGSVLWQPDSGQFVLNFEASEIAERVSEPPELAVLAEPAVPRATLTVTPPREPELRVMPGGAVDADLSADEWYEEGCELESSFPERAFEAYQRALELDPSIAGAHVNLGRQLHIAGELGRAEPHYREAVRLDPDDPTPHHNLGVLLEELGRKDEAIHAYRQAILRDPDFADAHCNLGLLLESLGRRQEAVRHLMAARKLSGEPE